MSLEISVPGKTFFVGEYLALKEGPSLVFLSAPRFVLKISRGESLLLNIHPESPAGLLAQAHPSELAGLRIEFEDAYQNKGGFGASTAQYLAVYSLIHNHINPSELLSSYYAHAWKGQGLRPSGADLIGQLSGSLSYFNKQNHTQKSHSWSFADKKILFFHTGNKVATHEHLKTLNDFDSAPLEAAFKTLMKGLEKSHWEDFVAGVRAYRRALEDLEFTCEPTLKLLKQLDQIKGVEAAKGCGALGADVILVLCAASQATQVVSQGQQIGLSLLATSDSLSSGLERKGSL